MNCPYCQLPVTKPGCDRLDVNGARMHGDLNAKVSPSTVQEFDINSQYPNVVARINSRGKWSLRGLFSRASTHRNRQAGNDGDCANSGDCYGVHCSVHNRGK